MDTREGHLMRASRRIPAKAAWCVDVPITSGVMSPGNVVVAILEQLGWENVGPGLGIARMCKGLV